MLTSAWLLAGCASATSGSGSVQVGSTGAVPSPTGSVRGFPSTSAASSTAPGTVGPASSTALPSSTTSPSSPALPSSTQAVAPRTVTVTGTQSGHTYVVGVWATSKVTNCAAHAYGAPLIAFFRQHPCTSATRRLVTLDSADGRRLAMSIIVVECQYGGATDPYADAGLLTTMERADGTGSMNDLLREGVRVPGMQSAIPRDEAFAVDSQDTVVTIFDAWYTTNATTPDDPSIVQLEHDLFLTPVAVPAS